MTFDPLSLMAGVLLGAAVAGLLASRAGRRARPIEPEGLSALAHDLRTPLSSIAAFGELIEEEEDPAERARFAAIIREEAGRLDAMIGERLGGTGSEGATPAPSAAPARGASHGRSILVVDDDRFIVEATRRLLEKEGYRASAAAGGEEALRRARTERPDLILMDLTMPSMGGDEALRLLRQSAETRRIPVIITTGEAGVGLPDGADALLVKPIARAALLSAVARALNPGAPA